MIIAVFAGPHSILYRGIEEIDTAKDKSLAKGFNLNNMKHHFFVWTYGRPLAGN
jgi:hypothetical protein